MSKRLYHFNHDFYYGEVSGTFWLTEKELSKMIGKQVFFGEVCGKHSAVDLELSLADFTDITDQISDPNFSIGWDLRDMMPKFDYIEVEIDGEVVRLTPNDIDEPADLNFEGKDSWSKTFYYPPNEYLVTRKEITEDDLIIYHAVLNKIDPYDRNR